MLLFHFLCSFQQLDGIDVLCHALCHVLSRFHSQYHRLWPVNHVASRKDTAACSHAIRPFYDLHVAFLVYLNALRRAHNAVGRSATDGQKDAIEVLDEFSFGRA